jgi:exopolysaccharide biosynthesis polyprenyl glycosylphosphotransferase
MSSVTEIKSRRPPGDRPAGESADPDVLVAENLLADDPLADGLLAAIDDHSRTLFNRFGLERRQRLVPRSLMIADLVGLSLAYLITTLFWGEAGALGSAKQIAVFSCTLPCWLLVAQLQGMYRADHEHADHSTTDDIAGVFYLVTIGVWVLLVASRLVGREGPSIYALITFWAITICALPLARIVARRLCRRSRAYVQNTLIVGAGEVGQLVGRKLVKHPEYGLNIVGFIDRHPMTRRLDLPEHLTILGGPERIAEVVESLGVERVIIAFSRDRVDELLMVLRQLRAFPVQVDLVPRLFELVGVRATMHSVEGLPLLGLPPNHAAPAARVLKRAIDVTVSAVALIVLAPLFAYIALRIRLDSDGPAFFRQTRLGTNMKEFTALKFRTMKVGTDQSVHRAAILRSSLRPADPNESGGMYKLERLDAVTPFGRGLRRTSLDELPQLINVFRGDMSLVGPRPCIPYETESFEPHHLERFAMPQGITGLWQVTARANCSFAEALDMDVAYVRGWSVGLDLRLLLRTPIQVLRQRRATA